MLSRDYLRENAGAYRAALKNRRADAELDRFIELDSERRRVCLLEDRQVRATMTIDAHKVRLVGVTIRNNCYVANRDRSTAKEREVNR